MDRTHDVSSTKRKTTAAWEYRLALFLLAGSGSAALGLQFLWTRRLADLLGATSESSARVFSAMFLGFAAGAAVTAWALPKVRRPWRLFALIELGIALFCLPILSLAEWIPWVWQALGSERLVSGWGFVAKFALSYLLITPPAFLIGTTVPLMVAAVCQGQKNAAEYGVWLYSVNTLGGVAGLAIVVGFGIQTLGVTGAMLLMMSIHVTIAGICIFQHARPPKEFPVEAASSVPAVKEAYPSIFRWMLLAAFCSGAGIMALEVLGLHLLNLATMLSFYHPAAILACVILVLAIAASMTPLLSRRFGGVTGILPLALAVAGLSVALVPVLFMRQVVGGGSFHYAAHFGDFLWCLFGLSLMSLGPAIFFAGLIFPLCVMGCGGHAFSRGLGWCLAINGIGGLLGAEISLRILLPTFGVHTAFGFVACLYAGLSVIFALRFKPCFRVAFPLIFTTVAITVVMFSRTLPRLPIFFKAGYETIEAKCGSEGSLAVVERDQLGRAMVFDNQYVLGSSGAASDMERQTHLPLLLHPKPERIGFLGLGTGITASGALRHGPVTSMTAIELSPLVVRAAALHFSEYNDNFCARSNVSVLVEDAGTHLAVSRERYDVIIGDLFTPWRPGEAALCTLEFFQAAHNALRSGGIYCQWIPMHQLTPKQFEVIVRTFQRVFPEVSIFRNHFKSKGLPLALIGFKGAGLDWSVVAKRCANESQRGFLSDPVCRHPEGLAMLYLGRYHDPSITGPINTKLNLWIELDAGQKWILGQSHEYFYGSSEAWFQLVQNQIARLEQDHTLPPSLRMLPRTGLLASRSEVARDLDLPNAAELSGRLVEALPPAFSRDTTANWALWPGSDPRHFTRATLKSDM